MPRRLDAMPRTIQTRRPPALPRDVALLTRLLHAVMSAPRGALSAPRDVAVLDYLVLS